MIPWSLRTYSSLANRSRIYTESPAIKLNQSFVCFNVKPLILRFQGLNNMIMDWDIGFEWNESSTLEADLVSITSWYYPIMASGEVSISTVIDVLSTDTMRAVHLLSEIAEYLREYRSSNTGTVISVWLLYVGYLSSKPVVWTKYSKLNSCKSYLWQWTQNWWYLRCIWIDVQR